MYMLQLALIAILCYVVSTASHQTIAQCMHYITLDLVVVTVSIALTVHENTIQGYRGNGTQCT